MCDGAHAEQTDRLGWEPFEAKYGIQALEASRVYWFRWPGRAVWERSRA